MLAPYSLQKILQWHNIHGAPDMWIQFYKCIKQIIYVEILLTIKHKTWQRKVHIHIYIFNKPHE